jgi:hypothetical protein
MPSKLSDRSRLILWGTLLLGIFTYGTVLLFHNIADGDLWAKLALGAAIWNGWKLPMHDVFAFTPVVPVYVDHEWGSGLVFFTLLKCFGPASLMLLKVALAFATLAASLLVARRFECSWPVLLALTIPCALCVLSGYIVVIRSHAFTYALFAATLFFLESIRAGSRWPALALVLLMVLWVNLHGGFVAGLGTIGIYAVASVLERRTWKVMLPVFFGCLLATFVNPYGPKYWKFVVPAILQKRPDILEWQPMPWWGMDSFLGFRILFVVVAFVLIFSRREAKPSWPGLCMLLITACLALRSRRHAPFFGIAALAFAGPYFEAAIRQIARRFTGRFTELACERAVFLAYALLALFVSARLLPGASLQVLAPVSQFPVREADILARSGLSGNLALPFMWGSYASWRLYPKIKISIDGRYEAAYPDSTYAMNSDFFGRRGPDWDRLLKHHDVDFIALDLQRSHLKPEDLVEKGFVTVWREEGVSALLASKKHAVVLQKAAAEIPPTTIEPLDATIPSRWPRF